MKFRNESFDTARLTKRSVLQSDIDVLGHVNNAVYVDWIQEAAVEHWSALADKSVQEKYLWFCSRHEIDYKQQVYPSEEVEIRTWLGRPAGARFDRYVDIRISGSSKPAVFAKTTWVLVSKSSRRPLRIQPEVLATFL